MLSFQLKEEVSNLLSSFESAQTFFQMLDTINNDFPEMDSFLLQISEGGQKAVNATEQLRRHLSALKNRLQPINIRHFYSSLEKFQGNLHNAKENTLDDLEIIDGISKSINEFSNKHENYLRSPTPQTATILITEARRLSSMLNGFKTALLFFEHNLEEQHYQMIDGNSSLSLYLPSNINLQQFASNLMALNSMYEELCAVMGVSLIDYPLVVNKIESGSFWSKLLGHSKVIALMDDIIRESASYIYRNFTKEGKLTAIPRKVEAIDSILQLTIKLEQAGINTEESKEQIKKSSVALSKELNTLLSGQSEITVNDTTVSIAGEIQKNLLNLKEPLQIEHNNPEIEDEEK